MKTWMQGWRAVTGHTGEMREDGTVRRYFPSVQFGDDAYHSDAIHVAGSLDDGEEAALLIAAAPEMLEALRECVQGFGHESTSPAMAAARAAIAKAEGRAGHWPPHIVPLERAP